MATYFLTDPAENEKIYRTFQNLYPQTPDYRAAGCLLFGELNEEGRPVGAMAAQSTETGYTICWLYVTPSARRQGAGTFLVEKFLEFVTDSMTFGEVEIPFSTTNRELTGFLSSLESFSLQPVGTEYYIRSNAARSAVFERLIGAKHHAEPWSEAILGYKMDFISKLQEEGIFTPLVPDWEDRLVGDLSLVKEKEGEITGAILVEEKSDGELEVLLFYSNDPETTADLLTAACKKWQEAYGDRSLVMTAVNEASEKMIEKLFPENEIDGEKYLASWNYR